MEQEHSIVAKNIRLNNWASDIKDCQSSGLTVAEWCGQHGIGIKNYYYRMKRVREAYLKEHPIEALPIESTGEVKFTELVPPAIDNRKSSPVVISAGHIRIEISESISDVFLKRIMGALADAV